MLRDQNWRPMSTNRSCRVDWRHSPPFGSLPRGRQVPSRAGRASSAHFEKRTRSTMTTGTIKKVVSDRGFGFIAAEDGKEYFFHRDGLDRSLEFDRLVGGEKVNFEVESSPRGPRAGRVSAA